MSKIVFFEAAPAERAVLEAQIALHPELATAGIGAADISFTEEKLSPKTAGRALDAEVVSIFINSHIERATIDALPALKLIVTRSTGFDHIDVAYARSRGISVANVPAYGSRTVAEYTFALILGLSRKTLDASHRIKSDASFDVYGLMGFDLQSKTIGIIGTGRIGQNVAQIARGFDMKVLAYDAFRNDEAAARIGFTYVPLAELLAQSDIVSLHVPFTAETRHLINKENIAQFKRGSLLINTARGEICDTEAIIYGVKEKILSGVGLDVVEGERRLKDDSAHLFTRIEDEVMHPDQRKRLRDYRELMNMPEVFITPHIAYYTREAQLDICKTTVEDVVAFVNGKSINVVA